MKCHEPGPPLLFTMIMNAMVMPRTTSSDSSRFTGEAGAVAGLVMVVAVAGLVISGGRLPYTDLPLPYPLGPWFAKNARGAPQAIQLRSVANLDWHFFHRAKSIREKQECKFLTHPTHCAQDLQFLARQH